MSDRKITAKETLHISRQISELSRLHSILVSSDLEVNPYAMALISHEIQRAIDNYKIELLNK